MLSPLTEDNVVPDATLPPLLEARDLGCRRNEVLLFAGLGFSLDAGEILQIDGANGSGKTSLLRILCGLAQAEQGEVLWCGQPMQGDRGAYLADLAYVAHANGVKGELTALENLAVAAALCTKTSSRSLEETLGETGLLNHADLPAANLSSGQRRRLALARLLVSAARLWILDEPFTALDEGGKRIVKDMITRHSKNGGTVILTTHESIDWQQQILKKVNL